MKDKKPHSLSVGSFTIDSNEPLTFILGPCAIESEEHAMACADFLSKMAKEKKFNLIFKASYDKANRSAHDSFRGVGIKEGLRILAKIRSTYHLPVITDIHTPEEAIEAGKIVDCVQIPAFLCRQTDLVLAAGRSGAIVNVKKGQFISPWDVAAIVEKLESVGCHKILLTDRGTSFGYNNLVCDMRSLPVMKKLGYPTCFDASHAVMLPGSLGSSSGGQREFIPTLASAAVAAGADVIFIECHPNPSKALSDKETVFPFSELGALVDRLQALRTTHLSYPL